MDLLDRIRAAVESSGIFFTAHALARATERHLPVQWAREVVGSPVAEVIEDYPADPRGPSCLIHGSNSDGRILHIQVSYPPTVTIITMYEPAADRWQSDLKTRRPEC